MMYATPYLHRSERIEPMKRTHLLLVGLLCLCARVGLAQEGLAQEVLPRDEAAIELVYQGKKQLAQKQFARAAELFEQAMNRPFNRVTTAAHYLAGLAHVYRGDIRRAERAFEELIQQYPRSRYVEEARYHRGLIWLRSARPERSSQGLYELLTLIDQAYNIGIVHDALNAVRHHFFYECDGPYLEELYVTLPVQHRLMAFEALCHEYLLRGQRERVAKLYQRHLRGGGEDSPYLQSLVEERPAQQAERPEELKIAMMLPLHLDDYLIPYADDIPPKTKSWLEFYEGFKLALEHYQPRYQRELRLKVLDTRRDLMTTRERIRELDAFFPQVVIGDVFNQPSEVISDWAERRGVPQIIPFSPTFDLREKSHTFLAHPALETRARRMAEYAHQVLELRKVVVWTDQTYFTEVFSNAFIQTFDTLGGDVIRMAVDSIYDRGVPSDMAPQGAPQGAKYDIPRMVRELKFQGVDGMYIPVSNEAISGLILSQLAFLKWEDVNVMGSSHWKRFERIDRELKESYGLLFTDSHHHDPDQPAYEEFYQLYLREYQYPPSDFCLQGFDLGMYVMNTLDLYDYSWGLPLSAYIRGQSDYEGIHLNYSFGGTQSNQFVNINQYHEMGIRKVNGSNWQQWELMESLKRVDTDSLHWNWQWEQYFSEDEQRKRR